MKKIIYLAIICIPLSLSSQVFQNNAPWMNSDIELRKESETTLKDISTIAENYFSTRDVNAKGSGFKPFKRWEYHWSHYTKEDGTITSATDLWKAWEQKKAMSSKANKSASNIGDWAPLGPYSTQKSYGQGRLNVVIVDPDNPNTYYVGAPAGGIWKSTDAGENWIPLTDHLPQLGVSGIAIHPTNSSIIYIATGDDDSSDSYAVGVWKSIDGGATWANTGAISGNPDSMNEIFIDPTNPETVLVATSTGVHKTINGGASWSLKLSGNIKDLKMKPNDHTVWYAASQNTVYKSTNAGESFNAVSIPALTNSLKIDLQVTQANSNYVYFVSANTSNSFNGIYRSTNSGDSFIKMGETQNILESDQAWYDLAIAVSDTDADMVFVGCLNIWKSTNGGNNFTRINEANNTNESSYTHADIHFMKYFNNKLFATTDGGIYISDDDGDSFTDVTMTLSISQFYRISVAAQNSSFIVGGLQDNGCGAFNGENTQWKNFVSNADGMESVIDKNNINTYYGFIQFGTTLHKTVNGGESSITILKPSSDITRSRWVTPLVANSAGLIYAGYSQLYELVNDSWIQISNHDFGGSLYHIEIDPNNDAVIYVSREDDLYISTDSGITFTQIPFSNGIINSIEISHNNSNTGWIVVNNAVLKSTNLNTSSPSFTNITNNLPGENKLIIKHHERSANNSVYLGTTLGVYKLDDTSNQWQVFDTDLPNVAVFDLEINEEDSKLFAGTYGRGIFVSDIERQLPNDDVRLLSVSNTNNITCETSFVPKITIRNQGLNTINTIAISYNVDSGVNNTLNWNGTIVSEQEEEIDLSQLNLTLGSHTITVDISITNDQYASNNSDSKTFKVNAFNATPTIVNTFESNTDVLLNETINSDNNLWAIQVPVRDLFSITTTSEAYITNPFGDYPYFDPTTSFLYTNCYDLSTISNPILKFDMAFDLVEDLSYMNLEYTLNNGESWQILGVSADANWYNSSSVANNLPGNQWTGFGVDANPLGNTNAALHQYSCNLAALTNESSIIFRFNSFIIDPSSSEEGVLIDNLYIEGTPLSLEDYNFSNSISISPNPSNGFFNIKSKNNDVFTIQIYNISGQKLLRIKNVELNIDGYTLNLNNLSKGIYFVSIKSKDKISVKKLIVN